MSYSPTISIEATYSEMTLEQVAALFHAAADRERLRLLSMLAQQELCVTDMSSVTLDDLPTISQRLRLLYQAGLVQRRRQGKHIYYSLAECYLNDVVFKLLREVQDEVPPVAPSAANPN
jgi:ArsR family transcriptional regulator